MTDYVRSESLKFDELFILHQIKAYEGHVLSTEIFIGRCYAEHAQYQTQDMTVTLEVSHENYNVARKLLRDMFENFKLNFIEREKEELYLKLQEQIPAHPDMRLF